jgi:hypothetical protein
MARTGRTDGCIGPLYAKSTRVVITCEMIAYYTCRILQTGFLQCGDRLLQQKIGIPMGNPLSPALAIAVCMHAEAKWLTTQVQRPVTGLRYMDDILMMTLGSTPDYATTAPTFYPVSLRVLPASREQPLQFLETLLAWVGKTPTFNYNNRNRHQSSVQLHIKIFTALTSSVHVSSWSTIPIKPGLPTASSSRISMRIPQAQLSSPAVARSCLSTETS